MSQSPSSSSDHLPGYDAVFQEILALVEAARRTAARTVNALMTSTYWQIGQYIVELEQGGAERAAYGQAVLERLSRDLSTIYKRGFSVRNLRNMRAFYQVYKSKDIRQTVSAESQFPLPWSSYVRLLGLDDPIARQFYEEEALRGGWSTRQLNRQIASQFYTRTLLSRNKRAMLEAAREAQPADEVLPEDEIKNPYVLEFLDLKDEYSESDFEEALIHKLEDFLLELGGEFTFVGRQRRLRIDDEWFRVDLLFFHRRLRCLVIIDLKIGEFSHADAGQMNMYVNYAREHWALPGENPPVGLILCATKRSMVAKYALDGLQNKVLAAEYRTALPNEALLVAELQKTRQLIEDEQVEIHHEQNDSSL